MDVKAQKMKASTAQLFSISNDSKTRSEFLLH